MKRFTKVMISALALAGMAGISGCVRQQEVVVAPPPAPEPIPPRPVPPMGASDSLAIPPLNAFGVRQTVNTGVSRAQTIWNLRSAYNVAALNCLQPGHSPILVGYRAFLRTHSRALAAANREVDSEFRKANGAQYIAPREAYMTKVYNFFAFPPTLPSFCDAALIMSQDAQLIKPAELSDFAARNLPKLDAVFDRFYRSYEQYRGDLAAWDARYGPLAAAQSAPASTEVVTP